MKSKQTLLQQSIRCKKKKTLIKEPMKTQGEITKLLKARENAGDQVVIGWECGASFMNQSQSEVKQNQ